MSHCDNELAFPQSPSEKTAGTKIFELFKHRDLRFTKDTIVESCFIKKNEFNENTDEKRDSEMHTQRRKKTIDISK